MPSPPRPVLLPFPAPSESESESDARTIFEVDVKPSRSVQRIVIECRASEVVLDRVDIRVLTLIG